MSAINRPVVTNLDSAPASGATYQPSDVSWDCAIGALPFFIGVSKERPLTRQTGPYRKQQFDASPIPGEQSMVYWWLRSQISFHGGAGILFEEPSLQPGVLYSDPLSTVAIPVRYKDSEGVDPWTQPGELTLLPGTVQERASTASPLYVMGAVDGSGADCWFQVEGSTLARCVEGSSATVVAGNTGSILSITQDGTNYYVADATGIYKGTLTGGAGSLIWDTGSSDVVLRWVKGRLVAAVGPSLYELVGTGPALPAPFFTALEPGFIFTDIVSGPDGIYVSGYSGDTSKIFYVGTTTGVGNVPILAPGVEVAQLPRGEIIYSLLSCMDSYLGIGTSKTYRLASFNGNGQITYGPSLIVPAEKSNEPPVVPYYSATTYDRFVFVAYGNGMTDGTSGLVRIDTGMQTQYQRYGWGKDLRAHVSGAVRSVTQFGNSGRVLFAVDGHGSYLAQPVGGNLESSGFLQTGNIRYHTQDPKLFQFINIRAKPITDGSVNVVVNDVNGQSWNVVTWTAPVTVAQLTDVALNSYIGPQEYISLTFTLSSNGTTGAPTMLSYQLKSLPAQKNQRLIELPLMVFDFERDKNGTRIGYEGYALDRLDALETMEEARQPVMYQDFSRHPFTARLVVIDKLQFVQVDPPTQKDGQGGYAMVTLRTIT